MNTTTLQCQSLSCYRGERLLFSDISFTLSSGQSLQIIGTNGSGKTSMLRILAGLSNASTGQLNWNQQALDSLLYRQKCGYLGHKPSIKAALSPRENIHFNLQLRQKTVSNRLIEQTLDKLELSGFEDEPSYTLSAGQQRRIALAQLLLNKTQLWLLDEPYTALDKSGIALLDELFEQHLHNQGLLIFASHQHSTLKQHQTIELKS